MLQRIYGTCWADEKSLKAYLTRLEEAAKRDHRKLGTQLDLFHFDECAPGSVFWHSKGWTLFQQLIAMHAPAPVRRRLRGSEYAGRDGPSLWEKLSGHWANYRDHVPPRPRTAAPSR